LVIAVGSLAWVVGVVTDVFASPAFSSFWWLSHYDANLAAFFGLSLFGSALIVSEYFWLDRHESKRI
jgi:hypothetical protein